MTETAAACTAYDEDLSALLDGELSEGREAEVRGHVESCTHCAARVEALRGVDRLLATAPPPPIPADLRARLEARLPAAVPPSPHSLPVLPTTARRRPPRRGRRFAAMGFAAAGAAASLALYLSARTPETPIGVAPERQIARSQPEAVAPMPKIPEAVARIPEPSAMPGETSAEVPEEIDLDAISDEELALALEFEAIEDLAVIANLDLLVRLLAIEEAG